MIKRILIKLSYLALMLIALACGIWARWSHRSKVNELRQQFTGSSSAPSLDFLKTLDIKGKNQDMASVSSMLNSDSQTPVVVEPQQSKPRPSRVTTNPFAVNEVAE